ncbi:uncharacterized protein LOC124266180 [Haliotis rubra]|uniref:uncharacterized protein LOC124266180 n=1 Tax=Haliotis rubra TaxID=36100 RepID=UPI001EE4F924|nr:uncharacterized protein LOC124266180 [Haliotis rubra]
MWSTCYTGGPTMKSFAIVTLACLVVAAESFIMSRRSLRASCNVDWTFSLSCTDVQDKLVGQIGRWTGPDGCADGGEKCLYKLVSKTKTQVKATRETPKQRYVDDLTFTFTQDRNKCNVAGVSRSRAWYAVLDYGTNYCNLHNLIVGAELDKSQGYREATSNRMCRGFSSADCSKS